MHRKDADSPPQACVEVLASVVRPEAVDSKVRAVLVFTSVQTDPAIFGNAMLMFRFTRHG